MEEGGDGCNLLSNTPAGDEGEKEEKAEEEGRKRRRRRRRNKKKAQPATRVEGG